MCRDAMTGDLVSGPFKGHTNNVMSVSFSPDTNYIVSGSFDKTIIVWDTKTGDVVSGPFYRPHRFGKILCAFSPDGKQICLRLT